jgi:hypothetical protein
MQQVMQYGRYAPASVCGWAGVIAAVPAVLIVGLVAVHRTSAPSPQPVGALGTTRIVHPHRASGRAASRG